jgi:transcriptional regulator with XRE-family HTH domain
MTPRNPTVRQKRLGAELRKLREAAGMSGEEAAAALECGQAKISRIETGVNGVRPFELRGLLKIYGVTDPELTEVLVEMAKDGNRRSWWNLYGSVLPGLSDLAELDSKAVSLHQWLIALVPGLLQTPDYMRTLFREGPCSYSAEEVEKATEARLARQEVLNKEEPPEYWAVLYEAALRAEIGGPKVMRAQWEHVIDLVEGGRIRLQVMPFSAGAHGGLDGDFLIYGMPVTGMDVVLFDGVAANAFLEHDDEVQRTKTLFDVLRATALGPGPSLDLIKQAAHQP